jgi:hypothetical protein
LPLYVCYFFSLCERKKINTKRRRSTAAKDYIWATA